MTTYSDKCLGSKIFWIRTTALACLSGKGVELFFKGWPQKVATGYWYEALSQQIKDYDDINTSLLLVAQMIKNQPAMKETGVHSLGSEDPLEKEMATHSSTPAWKILWREEPGGLQSTGLQRVGHD